MDYQEIMDFKMLWLWFIGHIRSIDSKALYPMTTIPTTRILIALGLLVLFAGLSVSVGHSKRMSRSRPRPGIRLSRLWVPARSPCERLSRPWPFPSTKQTNSAANCCTKRSN